MTEFPPVSFPSKLNISDQELLEKDVSMEEIKAAVWDCGNDKAGRPDGFTFGFIKRYWELIKSDIKMFVSNFLETKKMPMDSNSSFITLILKRVRDWCHTMPRKPSRRGWDVTSILVNGSPTSEFSIKRGLRQGDPLSPFLFIFIMEGLHTTLMEATNSGLIRGINIGSSNVTLSHIFYAYDVIITTDWSSFDMDNIIRVLQVFYLASGHKINIHKSNVYGVGVSDNEMSTMANNTGCTLGSFPFVYLGLPIGANMNLIVNWKILIDRFDVRLSKSKANLLSIGGRTTSVKSVLGSLGIYYLSISKAPESILSLLEKSVLLSFGVALKILLLKRFMVKMVVLGSTITVRMVYGLRLLDPLTIFIRMIFFLVTLFDFGLALELQFVFGKISGLVMPLYIFAIIDFSVSNKIKIASYMIVSLTMNGFGTGLDLPWGLASKEKIHRLSVIFASSLWWLWRYRNSVLFSHHPIRRGDIYDNIRSSSFSWLHHRGRMVCNWIDWLKSPMLVSSNGSS
ncbi:putative RNA-directed DNA polymerase, eukaryota, reverse transcriptase zinc-binding domain protein [Tanacetum coccineum]|uniref:RNA-directed DNA polymerase, eukaryota, reverse transcriptase zinc-binding domain protein n=1 Tax=Tanacetum coccineum TaxID=301880 RepID=A0ABQ5BKA5_9ASTR